MALQFSYVDVKTEILRSLNANLQAEGLGKVRVLKSDPRDEMEIPCISINRAGDDESSQSIGDEIGSFRNPETGQWQSFAGTFFHETLEVRIWHKNADERDRLYALVKAILFALRPSLVAKGLQNITIRGGRDEQENSFPPHPLYWGTITMNLLNPMEVQMNTFETITSVDVLRAEDGPPAGSVDVITL